MKIKTFLQVHKNRVLDKFHGEGDVLLRIFNGNEHLDENQKIERTSSALNQFLNQEIDSSIRQLEIFLEQTPNGKAKRIIEEFSENFKALLDECVNKLLDFGKRNLSSIVSEQCYEAWENRVKNEFKKPLLKKLDREVPYLKEKLGLRHNPGWEKWYSKLLFSVIIPIIVSLITLYATYRIQNYKFF